VGLHQATAGPRSSDRLSIRQRDDVISIVMDDEERGRAPPRQPHDIEIRPGESDALLAVGAEPVNHVGAQTELSRPEQRIADRVG